MKGKPHTPKSLASQATPGLDWKAPKAPTRRGFDPDTVVILKDVPLPEARKPRESAAATLLSRMEVGDCAVLPGPSARALMTFARKHGFVLKMRDMSDHPQHVARFGKDVAGVWMMAKHKAKS